MTPKEMITVEKEVYEAVLRNSVRVNDLEAENHKLKEINLWHSEKSWNCEKENQQLKELLSKCLDELAEFNNSYYPETQELFSQIVNAIGEK
jgi:hypothetical protein